MAISETEEKGIRVDRSFYTKISNRHLVATEWTGCSALAVLLYWWLCDKVTSAYDEDGVSIGVVMFGRPVPFATIANDKNLKSTWRAVQRNMEHLTERGFIRRKRCLTTQGYSYEVVGCAFEGDEEDTGKPNDKADETPEKPKSKKVKGRDGKTYTCPECGLKGYGTKEVFNLHLNTHADELNCVVNREG